MSRIGKSPVQIPEKVSVDIKGLSITVKGPKGELKRLMPEGVNFDQKETERKSDCTYSSNYEKIFKGKPWSL
jgi:ribosomal protein L6P/L9E